MSRLIEHTFERRNELLQSSGTWFHGFLSHEQATHLLKRERQGSFLFRLNESLPNCLIVSFVVLASGTEAGAVVRHRVLYRADLGYSFERRPQRHIYSLVDYCLWKIAGSASLTEKLERSGLLCQSEIVERMEEMASLFHLWRIGDVPLVQGPGQQQAVDGEKLWFGDRVFPTMPYVVQRNKVWLTHPVIKQ